MYEMEYDPIGYSPYSHDPMPIMPGTSYGAPPPLPYTETLDKNAPVSVDFVDNERSSPISEHYGSLADTFGGFFAKMFLYLVIIPIGAFIALIVVPVIIFKVIKQRGKRKELEMKKLEIASMQAQLAPAAPIAPPISVPTIPSPPVIAPVAPIVPISPALTPQAVA